MEDENENDETIPGISEVDAAEYDQQSDYEDYVNEQQEEQQFGSYPGTKIKDSIFTFFNNILKLKDSTKVANLDKRELGNLDLSVRNCAHLAMIGNTLHNKSYHDFFMGKSETILATSMSKKGWLPELVVSQKKFSQRSVQPMTANLNNQKKGFLGFGGSKETPPAPQ